MSRSVLIYTALAAIAIAGVAFVALREEAQIDQARDSVVPAAPQAAAHGDGMKKLILHETPKAALGPVVQTAEGQPYILAEFHSGQIVVLNFWATWCTPCRKEMGSLDRLEAALGGEDFTVLPVATGHNPVMAIKKFYEKEGLTHLPILLDPDQKLAASMGVRALPVTVILNRDGEEIGRLIGEAEWDSDKAQEIMRQLIAAW